MELGLKSKGEVTITRSKLWKVRPRTGQTDTKTRPNALLSALVKMFSCC